MNNLYIQPVKMHLRCHEHVLTHVVQHAHLFLSAKTNKVNVAQGIVLLTRDPARKTKLSSHQE